MSGYIAYLTRPTAYDPPLENEDTCIGCLVPHFWVQLVLFTALFSGLCALIPPFIRRWLKGYPEFDDDAIDSADKDAAKKKKAAAKNRRVAATYLSALVHHLYVVPLSAYLIYRDMTSGVVDIQLVSTVVPWTTAYMLSDTLFTAVPDLLKGDYEYTLHHLLGLGLCTAGYLSPPAISRWVAHLLMMEASTLFMSVMWFSRKTGREDTLLYKAGGLGFVLAFTLTRTMNYPACVWAMFTAHGEETAKAGPARYVLLPLMLMQWWWWVKIVKQIVLGEGSGSGGKGKEKKADASDKSE